MCRESAWAENMNSKDQHRHFLGIEKRWEGQAKADQHYNQNRADEERKAGNLVLSHNYQQEADWDSFWAKRRAGLVKREEKKGK